MDPAPFSESLAAGLNRVTLLNNIPLSAELELTYRCPNRCVHCYLPQTSGRVRVSPERELSTKEWEKVILQLKKLGCLFLVLTGGEPLLRKDLAALCGYATKLGFEIKIFTSGAGLSRELMEKLRKTNVSRFELSFYGWPDVHDSITGVRGSGLRALAAARALKKAGFKVKLKTPIMKQTAGELKYIAALADKNGFERSFDPVLTIANDGEASNLGRRVEGRALKALLEDPSINPLESNDFASPAAGSPVCVAGRNTVSINPYGEVSPCLQLPVKLGNVGRSGLNDIWNHAVWLKKWRQRSVSDIQECCSCADIDFCSRCPGVSLLEEGDIDKPYKTACEIAGAMRRVAGRNPGVKDGV
jgi:radical SAM protein with 4Fe4S-binding SPASM domain